MPVLNQTSKMNVLRFALFILLLICVSLWTKHYIELLNNPQSYQFICPAQKMSVTFVLLFAASALCFLFLIRPPLGTLSFIWGCVFFVFLFAMLSDAVSFFYAPLYYHYDGSRLYNYNEWFWLDIRGFCLCILGVLLLYYKPRSMWRRVGTWLVFVLLVLASLPWEYVGFE